MTKFEKFLINRNLKEKFIRDINKKYRINTIDEYYYFLCKKFTFPNYAAILFIAIDFKEWMELGNEWMDCVKNNKL